jgi:fido (protein-threonine AMPylation protein)
MPGLAARHSLLEQANQIDTETWIRAQFNRYPATRQVDAPFLLEVNERLLRNVQLGPNIPCISGSFRKTRLEVRTTHGTYHPPDPEQVPSLLSSHFSWLGVLKTRQVSTVSRAMQLAVSVCAIHPFMEGNGRTARMASLAVLFLEGYRYRRQETLVDYFERERKRWTIGMWLAVKGNSSALSTLYCEAVSVLMQRPLPFLTR